MVPGWGMYSGHIEWRKNPNYIIGDEQMRACGPVHFIPVVSFQRMHPLLAGMFVPVGKGRHRGVMEHDEVWFPRVKLHSPHVGIKIESGKSRAHNPTPSRHDEPPSFAIGASGSATAAWRCRPHGKRLLRVGA